MLPSRWPVKPTDQRPYATGAPRQRRLPVNWLSQGSPRCCCLGYSGHPFFRRAHGKSRSVHPQGP
jgi:hypothetical protein